MRTPVKLTLEQRIAQILIQLQTRWDRLNNLQRSLWNAYSDFRFISDSSTCTVERNSQLSSSLSGRQLFILQNFYRLFYGPVNDMGPNPIMLTPVFTETQIIDDDDGGPWGPKGEWSNKDIFRFPFPLDNKKHFAIIWESAPIPELLHIKHAPSALRLMRFTTLNGRDQDTTIPYREQFEKIPKAGEYIFARVGFANKLTGVVSNLITLKLKVVSKP